MKLEYLDVSTSSFPLSFACLSATYITPQHGVSQGPGENRQITVIREQFNLPTPFHDGHQLASPGRRTVPETSNTSSFSISAKRLEAVYETSHTFATSTPLSKGAYS